MSNLVSSIRNIRGLKALKGDPLRIDLGRTYAGVLVASMKKDPTDTIKRDFSVVDGRYLELTADQTVDLLSENNSVIQLMKGRWYFDVEQTIGAETKTIITGTILFQDDITNSNAFVVRDSTIEAGGSDVELDPNTSSLAAAFVVNNPNKSLIWEIYRSGQPTQFYQYDRIQDVWVEIGGTAPAQVQSNWNETDTESPAFILNKPTIPTVPDQVQSDWNETDTADPAFILNKPVSENEIFFSNVNVITGINSGFGNIASILDPIAATVDDPWYLVDVDDDLYLIYDFDNTAYKMNPHGSYKVVFRDKNGDIVQDYINSQDTGSSTTRYYVFPLDFGNLSIPTNFDIGQVYKFNLYQTSSLLADGTSGIQNDFGNARIGGTTDKDLVLNLGNARNFRINGVGSTYLNLFTSLIFGNDASNFELRSGPNATDARIGVTGDGVAGLGSAGGSITANSGQVAMFNLNGGVQLNGAGNLRVNSSDIGTPVVGNMLGFGSVDGTVIQIKPTYVTAEFSSTTMGDLPLVLATLAPATPNVVHVPVSIQLQVNITAPYTTSEEFLFDQGDVSYASITIPTNVVNHYFESRVISSISATGSDLDNGSYPDTPLQIYTTNEASGGSMEIKAIVTYKVVNLLNPTLIS